jgi:hypothetical protein
MPNTGPRSYRLPSNKDFSSLCSHSHALLKPSYASYCSNPPGPVDTTALPTLQLLPSSDIYVKIVRDDINDKITSFTVTKISDPSTVNFMGYYLDEHCLAFRGEVRLFKEFLHFASETVGFRAIEGCIKTGKEIRYPCPGLGRGLSFEDFAARVEIVEYVVILNVSMRDREGMFFAFKLKTSAHSPSPQCCNASLFSSWHLLESPRVSPNTWNQILSK